MYREDSGSMRRQLGASAPQDRRQANPTVPGLALNGSGQMLGKRGRTEYDTPDLPSHADREQWLDSQHAAFEAAATAGSGGGPSGATPSAGTATAGGVEAEGNSHGSDSSSSRQQRSRSSAQHAAIFGLVYGLLEEGQDRR